MLRLSTRGFSPQARVRLAIFKSLETRYALQGFFCLPMPTVSLQCLDVTNGANVDGTKLQIWTCASGNTSKWMPALNRFTINRCLQTSCGFRQAKTARSPGPVKTRFVLTDYLARDIVIMESVCRLDEWACDRRQPGTLYPQLRRAA